MDQITAITKDATQWDISYSVEKDGATNLFCVVVLNSDMVDATSEAEAKTLANVRAGEIKDAWTPNTDMPVVVSDTPENVTL